MWKCPVCDQENTVAAVCPQCGYDRTCDYEQYPTAIKLHLLKLSIVKILRFYLLILIYQLYQLVVLV